VLRDVTDSALEDAIAAFYMEGTDQTRGWFHSRCSPIRRHHGPRSALPQKRRAHGFTLDEKGMNDAPNLIGNTIVRPKRFVFQTVYGDDICAFWGLRRLYTRTADRAAGNPERDADQLSGRLAHTCGICCGAFVSTLRCDRTEPMHDMPELNVAAAPSARARAGSGSCARLCAL